MVDQKDRRIGEEEKERGGKDVEGVVARKRRRKLKIEMGKQRVVVSGGSSRDGQFETEEEDFQGGETNVEQESMRWREGLGQLRSRVNCLEVEKERRVNQANKAICGSAILPVVFELFSNSAM